MLTDIETMQMNDAHDSLILNVDDTEAARYAKSRVLARAGFRVIEAATGTEALEMAQREMPHLVLLDVKLPDINGFEVARLLKQDPRTQMILILQTSASYVNSADKVRALDGGADNYLVEPIEPDELVANVNALLRLGRVETELREMDRRKDEFLATLAHELRNPLAPIRNAVELLRCLDPYVPAQQEGARQTILRQTDHLIRLVDDLMDVSRITQGKLTVQRKPIGLKASIHGAIETVTPMIQRRKHILSVDLPENELWVLGDHVRLCQILGNLLHNAAKFTQPGGEISVSATRVENNAVITIKDNGIGLATESIGLIFERFTQAEHPRDSVQDGLGIGLSIVKTLVTMHDGNVIASSCGLNKGSTFEVSLPIIEPDTTVSAAETIKEATIARRILIVDDNVDAADILCSLLQISGHQVQVCYNGTSALACAEAFQPEVAFVDIGLPDMTGYDLAVYLRALPAMQQTALFALTGYSQAKEKQRSLDAGFSDHFVKPIGLDKLSSILSQ
jgi:signal transduction histidine kinase